LLLIVGVPIWLRSRTPFSRAKGKWRNRFGFWRSNYTFAVRFSCAQSSGR